MRNKAFLLFTATLAFASMGITISPILEPDFWSFFDPIGPYVENNQNVKLKGYYYSKNDYSNVRERLSIAVIGEEETYFSTTKKHTVEANQANLLTFTLPLSDMLTKKGISCMIQVLNSESNPMYFISFNLKPVESKTINPGDYLNSKYEISDVVVDPDDYLFSHVESFTFKKFLDYFDTDHYYRIDVAQFSINYSCPKKFVETYGVLSFTDYDKLFPYLDNADQVPSFDIPITAYQSGTKINFKFKNTMYVHPKTLEMSFIPRNGFVATKYFYLPRNKTKQMLNQLFTLKMEKFGYGQINFSWDVRYINNRNLIGDCNNSDFCVVEEVL